MLEVSISDVSLEKPPLSLEFMVKRLKTSRSAHLDLMHKIVFDIFDKKNLKTYWYG